MLRSTQWIMSFIGALIPSVAWAHIDSGDTGFLAGFSHPVLGLDHLLAMLSVGMLSVQMGGKAIWSVPFMFVIVMLIGGGLGLLGIPLMSVELGIALSVLVLGLVIAFGKRLPMIFVMVGVSFFALFHGYAHGAEMPAIAQPVFYVAGFALGTGAIHITGVLIAQFFRLFPFGRQLIRYTGAGIASVGMYLLMS